MSKLAIMQSRSPVNTSSPGGQGSYYLSNEDQTGPSTTTSPPGGWNRDLILADTIRHRVAYKEDRRLPA